MVIMGVAGSGKTLIGSMLARDLEWPFFDADDFHSAENVLKMSGGNPLSDEDRGPWLDALLELLRTLGSRNRNAILACSALRAPFREQLRKAGKDVRFVYLEAGPDLIDERLQSRVGHFMPAELATSQFAALEVPESALVVPAGDAPESLVSRIRQHFDL